MASGQAAAAARRLRHQLPRAGHELHLPGAEQRLLLGDHRLLPLPPGRRADLQLRLRQRLAGSELCADRQQGPEVGEGQVLRPGPGLVAQRGLRCLGRLLEHQDRQPIVNLDPDMLLKEEADCRLGVKDINSPSCVDTLNRVQRYPLTALNQPGEIKDILVNPINAAYESTSGIDISTRYALRTAGYGAFVVKAAYSKTLKHESRQFAGDPTLDDLADTTNQDWRDKLNVSLNWNRGDWSDTVFLQRFGKTASADGTFLISPTTLVNASTVYSINKRTTLTLSVNNLFNKVKMDDSAG